MILCGLFITTSSLLMAAMLGALRLLARFCVRDSSCLLQNKGLFLKVSTVSKCYTQQSNPLEIESFISIVIQF